MGKMSMVFLVTCIFFLHFFEALNKAFEAFFPPPPELHFYTLSRTLITCRAMQLRFFKVETFLNNAFHFFFFLHTPGWMEWVSWAVWQVSVGRASRLHLGCPGSACGPRPVWSFHPGTGRRMASAIEEAKKVFKCNKTWIYSKRK